MEKKSLEIEKKTAWQQEAERRREQREGRKKKSNLLCVEEESINSTCEGRLAKRAGKLHVNKYSKHLPPTIFLPLDSAKAFAKTQNTVHN